MPAEPDRSPGGHRLFPREAVTTLRVIKTAQRLGFTLHPGLVRTEGVMQLAEELDLSDSQSPEGIGRAVAALAADPNLMSRTGQALLVTDLAKIYGVDVTT